MRFLSAKLFGQSRRLAMLVSALLSLTLAGCDAGSSSDSTSDDIVLSREQAIGAFTAGGLGAGDFAGGGIAGGPRGPVGPGTGGPIVFVPTNATTNTPVVVTSIEVTPDPAVVAVNATAQLSITARQPDGQPVTLVLPPGGSISYLAADPSIASVSSSGLVTGIVAGNTTVTVTVSLGTTSVNDTVGVQVTGGATPPPPPTPPTPPPNPTPNPSQRLFVSGGDGILRALNPNTNYSFIEQTNPPTFGPPRNMGFMTYSPVNQHVIVGLIGPTGGAVQFESTNLPLGEGAINTNGTSTFDVAFDTALGRLYAANFSSNNVAELDASGAAAGNPVLQTTLTVPGARQIEFDPRGFVYVSNHVPGASALTVLQTNPSPAVQVANVATGLDGDDAGEALAFDSGRNRVYLSNVDGDGVADTVRVIDVSNAAAPVVSAQILDVGVRPVSIAVDRDHDRVYVLNRDSGTLSIFDAFNNLAPSSIAPSILVGTQPSAVLYDSVRDHIVVANQGSGTVTVYDAVTLSSTPLFTTTVNSPAGLLLGP